jgi:hypothetical protein
MQFLKQLKPCHMSHVAPFNVTRPLTFCEWMWVGHQTNAQRQSLEVCHDQLFENIKLWVCGMFMH